MNRESFSRARERGALQSRVRFMHQAIGAGDPVEAKEQAIWAAHLGMAVLGMDDGLIGWGIYNEVVKWWNGGNS